MIRFVTVSLACVCLGIWQAPLSSADELGYLNVLDSAGVLSHNGSTCNMINGLCNGQFQSARDALATGRWVCDQVAGGKSKSMIIDWLSHGEGLMPSTFNGKVITNAAISNLC